MRLIFTLVLGALEATVVSLPLTAMTTLGAPWPLLFAAVATGWLADQIAARTSKGRERVALGLGAVAGGLLLPAALLGGPLAALGALLPGSTGFAAAYTLLLLGLFLFWRGTRLDTRDSAAVGTLFGRGAAAGVTALILGSLFGSGAPTGSLAVLAHVVALGALGLTALALAHAQDSADGRLAGLSWRWIATLLAAVALVILLATLATSLLGGGEGLAAARALITAALLPLALIGSLIAWLILTFLAEPLIGLIRAIIATLQGIQVPEPPPPQAGEAVIPDGGAMVAVQRLAEGATFLMALIPLVILVAAILLLRRRRRGPTQTDEERESLGVLDSLGGDLRDLLGKLRQPFGRRLEGLQAALAALRGEDATTRVRRAYVRLLLLLEGRGTQRPNAETPGEFGPTAAHAARAPEAVARLTTAYERARYNPTGASPADADSAEAALRAIEP